MPEPTTYIVSDIHLGDPHCRTDLLARFLDWLPEDAELVLNGDTLDDPALPLPPVHAALFERLMDLARAGRLVWVRGNHDDSWVPPSDFVHPSGLPIAIEHTYFIGRDLLVTHGDSFHAQTFLQRCFVWCFRRLHSLRIMLGAHPVHVAQYAKSFGMLYAILRRNVRHKAVGAAQEIDIATVTCGHVHYHEDSVDHGVRYLNTGCWLEPDTWCVIVEPGASDDGPANIRLVDVDTLLSKSPAGHETPAPR